MTDEPIHTETEVCRCQTEAEFGRAICERQEGHDGQHMSATPTHGLIYSWGGADV